MTHSDSMANLTATVGNAWKNTAKHRPAARGLAMMLAVCAAAPLSASSDEAETRKLHGYFYTLDHADNTVCIGEQVNLTIHQDGQTVEAITGANVHEKDGHLISRKWRFRGFKYDGNIALAFMTVGDPPIGTGTYYLMTEGDNYVGHWEGVDLPLERVVRCPYLMTPKDKPAGQTCEQAWPEVFDGKPCAVIRR